MCLNLFIKLIGKHIICIVWKQGISDSLMINCEGEGFWVSKHGITSNWCCHFRKRDIPICVITDVNRHPGLVSLSAVHISMRGLNSWSLFLKLQSQYYKPVLSCINRSYQITHGASCPSACILGGCRFRPSWHTRSIVLLKIARTYKSWWDLCVSLSLLLF